MRICHIIIWLNLNNGQYYHKFYKHLLFITKYEVGFINQYNHKVIDIIDLQEFYARHKSLKRLLKRLISFLENILKKL